MFTCSNGNQLQFNTTNPSDSWQISVHQQMIGFIIETPLTNNQGRTNILQKKLNGILAKQIPHLSIITNDNWNRMYFKMYHCNYY